MRFLQDVRNTSLLAYTAIDSLEHQGGYREITDLVCYVT
jgi:hypothetical protein